MDYSGMTANERLFEAGLMEQFDGAANKRDRSLMIEILEKVQLNQEQAERTVDSLLVNSRFYG